MNNKILISIIIFAFVFLLQYKYYVEQFEENKSIKILNLVLYSSDNGGAYDKMKTTTENFYKKFANVKTVYYRYAPDLDKDIELRDNVLYVKGDESYIPGILQKTLETFEFFRNDLDKYDYVVRSNVSTIIRFDILSDDLKKNPVDYGCAVCWGADKVEGHEKLDHNYVFSSGTSIILSSKTVKHIINNKDQIDKTIIDDVSIGKFISEKMPELKMKPVLRSVENNGFNFVPNYNSDEDKLHDLIKNNKIIFFRNNNDDRELDAKQMGIIADFLMKNYYAN
jgi:hypothetical protein